MKKLPFLLLFIILVLLTTFATAEGRRMKHLAGFVDFLTAVQKDGTVKAIGDNEFGQCDTSFWRNVIAVAAGHNHALGLKSDGTVYAAGDNRNGQCNVQDWTDIIMIAAGASKSIGLKSDGTVVYTGFSYEDTSHLENWRDIIWVGADWSFCGVDKDGNVFGTFEFDVSGFYDVVQVYEDSNMTYALTRDGRVQITSEFYDNYETVNEISAEYYDNIREIGGCGPYFAALRQDGTVDCAPWLSIVEDWTDIVEIEDVFGVKSDGSIVYVEGYLNDFPPEQLAEISTWKVMVDPDSIPAPSTQTAAAAP